MAAMALLAGVLADGTNLGLARMADASRSLSYHHLVNVAQWHISDDNYVAARAAIISIVWPLEIVAFGSAPAFSRTSISAAFPASAASESGVTP